MRVLLVRHAIAANRHPARWPDDSQRPLTDAGISKFRSAARGLGSLVPNVDRLLASPYPRAFDTAQILHEEAAWVAPEPCPQLEAERRPEETIGLLANDAHVVALVGHEPLLSAIASLLLTGTSDTVRFTLKKGGAVLLELPGDAGDVFANLQWSLPPKVLRALGRPQGA